MSRNLWIDAEEDIGFEMANDDDNDVELEPDPFDLGASVTVLILRGAGIGGGTVLVFSVKSRTTCR